MADIYRLTSILSWFHGGYVDVGGSMWGSHPTLFGNQRKVYSTTGLAGSRSFNCNHMPIIEDDATRKALAFWREGKRLQNVHAGYSFLSFYKVIESQFPKAQQKAKTLWISSQIDALTGRAASRVQALRAAGTDVSKHLFESCRCAVAHAGLGREIVDPDVPADRARLDQDLDVMEQLATVYIADVLSVPNARSSYRTRDRLAPWDTLLGEQAASSLRAGRALASKRAIDGKTIAVGLWPNGPVTGLEAMRCAVIGVGEGLTVIQLTNDRQTIALTFQLDHVRGRIHTDLERSGLARGAAATEADVVSFATFFYHVLANATAELTVVGYDPVDCEVVIPVNVFPVAPSDGIAAMLKEFRRKSGAN
ncbi:methylamine utilization protein MauJ [Sphingomonas phyllosphaerae]|uniref:methylamine utilization protein MauJ n=1 Tax=Sphingomonas phyllosphaerae TaxID=257003 RepID=UPI002413A061|nr:methylamine utilization protein MauJ [Sphingomonas phyllosphaerae]